MTERLSTIVIASGQAGQASLATGHEITTTSAQATNAAERGA